MRTVTRTLLAVALFLPRLAHADVVAHSDQGFVSRNVVQVKASPAQVWQRLVKPAAWWASDHTFSGDAANLSIEPVAGGCFCEVLPGEGAGAPPKGGVQHMRVVNVETGRVLRMTGALGPLQSEAVNATLTITLTAHEGGTRVIFEYVVGGYMRYPIDKISSAVDIVLANQQLSLAKAFPPAGDPVGKPAAAPAGHGLDPQGVLLPRGRIWSLPAGNAPATPPAPGAELKPVPDAEGAPAAELKPVPDAGPAPAVPPASLPTAALPPDIAATDHSAPAPKPKLRKAAHPPKPAPAAADPAPQGDAAQSGATGDARPADPPPAPKPATRPRTRRAHAAPPPPAATQSDEPSRDAVNSAVDAALGKKPPADAAPQR